jgi:hypothetical protein
MKKLIILAAALLVLAGTADAKWWIFGKSKTEVGLKYLFINKLSADETGPKIKLFRESLGADGLVRITGRASGGATGSVRITLDDKATWQDVKFADNGTFEHSFKPEPGKTYALLIEVTDTAGKTNKPEDTRKELSLSDENIQAKVKETLDALFAAYGAENLQKFMSHVGENFAGDKAILERAVKRDFDALSNINMRYTLNNVAAGAQGRVFVSITFNRMVFVNKTGASSTDSGTTEFVFDSREGKLSLFSMKQPLMFGLSDADNVATGEVLGNTGANLVLDDGGNLGSGTLVTFTNTDRTSYTRTYTLDDGTLQLEAGFATVAVGDIGVDISHIWLAAGVEAVAVTGKSLSQLTLADMTSAAWSGVSPATTNVSAGKIYAFKASGAYYAMEIISNNMGDPSFSITTRVRAF